MVSARVARVPRTRLRGGEDEQPAQLKKSAFSLGSSPSSHTLAPVKLDAPRLCSGLLALELERDDLLRWRYASQRSRTCSSRSSPQEKLRYRWTTPLLRSRLSQAQRARKIVCNTSCALGGHLLVLGGPLSIVVSRSKFGRERLAQQRGGCAKGAPRVRWTITSGDGNPCSALRRAGEEDQGRQVLPQRLSL